MSHVRDVIRHAFFTYPDHDNFAAVYIARALVCVVMALVCVTVCIVAVVLASV